MTWRPLPIAAGNVPAAGRALESGVLSPRGSSPVRGTSRWSPPFHIRLACRTLTVVGGFVDGIGFGLMVVGVVIFAIGLAVRSNYVRNVLRPDALPLWFRGEGLILLGGSLELLGIMVAARLAWPWLIVIALLSSHPNASSPDDPCFRRHPLPS